VIISVRLLAACIVSGAVYLLVVGLIWNWCERFLPTLKDFPRELTETKNASWFISCFIIEFIFFVLMPSVIYGWFYTVIPFSGARGGVAVALYVFLFGAVPLAMLIMFRIRIPAVYVMYQLVGIFLKLIGAMAITGYLYSL